MSVLEIMNDLKASSRCFTCKCRNESPTKNLDSLLQAAQQVLAGGRQQTRCRLTSSDLVRSPVASEEEVCPAETSSNVMASSQIHSLCWCFSKCILQGVAVTLYYCFVSYLSSLLHCSRLFYTLNSLLSSLHLPLQFKHTMSPDAATGDHLLQ